MYDLITLVGGQHRYQKKLLAAISLILFIQGFLDLLLPYIYFVPDFTCIDNTTNPPLSFKCSETQACQNPGGFEVSVVRTSIVSIHELWCEREYLKSWAISIINFGASFLFYGINMLADKFGRNLFLRLAALLMILTSCACIFVTDFHLNTILTLLIWLSSDITLSLSFIYFLEFSSDSIRQKSNAILFYAYTLGIIFGHILNSGLGDFRTMYLFVFLFTMASLFVYFFMIETPYFYYSQANFSKFKDTLLKIYSINKSEIETTEGRL